jgi:hypothetical protein
VNDGKPFRSAARRGRSVRAAISFAVAIATSAMTLALAGYQRCNIRIKTVLGFIPDGVYARHA